MSQSRRILSYDSRTATWYTRDESTDDERLRPPSSSRPSSSRGAYDRLSSVEAGCSERDYESGHDRYAPILRLRRPGGDDQPYRFSNSRYTDQQGRLRDLDTINEERRRARPGSIEFGSRRYFEVLHDQLRRGITSEVTMAEEEYLRERAIERNARMERGESVSSDSWTDGSPWSSRPSSQQGPVTQGSSRAPSRLAQFPNPFAQPPEPGLPQGPANPAFSPRHRTRGRLANAEGSPGISAQGSSAPSGRRNQGQSSSRSSSYHPSSYNPKGADRDEDQDSTYSCGQPRD